MVMNQSNGAIEVLDQGINLVEEESFGACCWSLFAVLVLG